ncbi:COG1470 family protein [Amycolatopsis taiwanensis]|uniref:FixG C-terminal immunoglobulin-like domain-containing protein n=1 Tax=Amycolatopsis taiwanensis TaxID=342230 RepID=A0A9W6R7N9_9PSEU|nr:hypothetical protein [Amycolatopsis taiwanensis]GLY69057.1 hypothetical protein Atai01_56760 [Amycolatopsis taiwanensis]
MVVRIELPPEPITIEPGGRRSCEVMVHNLAAHPDRFLLEVIGSAAHWTDIDPPTLTLGARSSGRIRLVFHPPRASHVRAGTIPFALLAGAAASGRTAMAEGQLSLGTFFDTELELLPRRIGRKRAYYLLQVHNRGNDAVHLELRGRPRGQRLRIDCTPAALVLFPGQAEQARIDVRRTAGDRGDRLTEFQVIAHPAGQDPRILTERLASRRWWSRIS